MSSFSVLAVICIAAHVIRSAYEIARHRGLVKPGGIVFAAVFTDMALLWFSWFALCQADTNKAVFAPFFNYLGLAVSLVGLIIFLTALLTIKTFESYDGKLITTGIYSWFRHPMYAAFIMWLLGFPIFTGSLTPAWLVIPFIANVLFWRRVEELELTARFPEYTEYKTRVKLF